MRRVVLPTLILFASLSIFTTCERQEFVFPVEPAISFVSFEPNGAAAKMTISFTDGDGDLGFFEGQDEDEFNMYLTYHELTDTGWTVVELSPPFNYRIPSLTPEGQNPAVKGQITIDLTPNYYNPITNPAQVFYEIELNDRAGNESNKISTPIIDVQ
jgi:hypothetical protein